MNVGCRQYVRSAISMVATVLLFLPEPAKAQLTDSTQTTPNVPGGTIGKSLEQQVGAGQGDVYTAGSSMYLIKRDPARSIRRGRQAFQRKFTLAQGLGPRVSHQSNGDIQQNPAFGAGLADSCASCHGRPRGAAGFGGDVATRPDSRDAPHLFGAGLVEMLADEMTSDLRAIRTRALERARSEGRAIQLALVSKSVRFGAIRALPDGQIATSLVEGVNADLRVRPFFAHGGEYSLRAFSVGGFNDEMGLQAMDPLLCQASDPVSPIKQVSAAGFEFDPALDSVKRPPVCSPFADADGDGVVNEIDPAVLDYMEFYLLNYFKPATGETTRQAQHGVNLMKSIGCTSCHTQSLTVNRDRRVADVETRFDAERGIFNRLFATATLFVDTVSDGYPFPQLLPQGHRFVVDNFFSDLKRHDLGPAFHERQYDGSLITHFVTEPLWGVATSAPYGHDGRSISLKEVILRHGGEAQQSRDAFAALSENGQQRILEFLGTLVLFPPDDTASNLNPGTPGTTDPQSPDEHGSINLGALFQIPLEGPE